MAITRQAVEQEDDDELGASLGFVIEQAPVQIWDVGSARRLRNIDLPTDLESSQRYPTGDVLDVLFPADSDIIGVQDNTHHYAFAMNLGDGAFSGWGVPHSAIISSPAGDRFATILAGAGAYCNIILYDRRFSRSGGVVASAEDENACFASPKNFSNDLNRLAVVVTALGDGEQTPDTRTVQVLDIAGDQPLRIVPGDQGAISPDGLRLAVWENGAAGAAGRGVVYEVSSGRQLAVFAGHQDRAVSLAWSPDGRTIATGGMDSLVFLWDAATGAQRLMFGGFPGPVCGVGFSPQGQGLLTRCRDMIRAYDVRTGRLLNSFERNQDGVLDFLYSPDFSAVAVVRNSTPREVAVELWRFAPR